MTSMTLKTQRKFHSDVLLEKGLFLKTLKNLPSDAVWFYDESLPSYFIDSLNENVEPQRKMGIAPKEKGKSFESFEAMLQFLDGLDISSSTEIFALGGGALTDAVGLVASLYLRGLKLTFIPTTLLAMVDASIGGKTALNTIYKNRIGSFYPAHQILIDFDFLNTMPKNLIEDGMVEIIKIALLFDEPWVQALEHHAISLEASIEKAIRHKMSIVEKDLTDHHERKLLNLGHTLGHAIEAFHEFKFSHGNCVAWGLLLEHYSKDFYPRMKHLLESYGCLKKMDIPFKSLMPYLMKDKKRTGLTLDMIQLDSIGQASIQKMTMNELTEYITSLSEGFYENT
jgi:3-dehydroquinate synthase